MTNTQQSPPPKGQTPYHMQHNDDSSGDEDDNYGPSRRQAGSSTAEHAGGATHSSAASEFTPAAEVETDMEKKKKQWHLKPRPRGDVGGGGGKEAGPDGLQVEESPELQRMSSADRRAARVGKVELDPNIDYADWKTAGPGLTSRASVDADGMINIWVDLKDKLPDLPKDYARPVKEWATEPDLSSKDCPPLNIVIFIVGSRGDVQPYLSLALRLIQSNAHRVRIATHPDFEDFVNEVGKRLKGKQARGIDLEGRLEYYNVGGSPKELMAFMVKNPGLIPGWESIKNGDILSKRRMTAELLDGFYRSTHEPNPTTRKAFAADAIISNPPAFGHVHIAEALGLPLLMSFTMPWSPSTSFKHPLVNIRASNAESGLTNYFTYALAEMLQWQGLGDVINLFRTGTLGLEPLSGSSGPSVLERLKVPWTYCWSQGLIEKPDDWKEHIDISGFYFLEGESDFKPDDALEKFLKAGEAPIYIGFGSVVVEDAVAMTTTIFEAVEKAGVRALVSAGWGGLGGTDVPEQVYILKGNIPHDWLFADGRVKAVCHHGGAGTTAIGLRNGLPTIVVPFFGDQKFWGDMIHRAGGGPEPIPQKTLNADNLSEAIKFAVSEPAKKAAGVMGEQIRKEDGETKGVQSFHRHLPLRNMRCEVDPGRIAYWWSDEHCLRLSGAVAGLLKEERGLEFTKLTPIRAREYQSRWKASDPISGGSAAVLHMVSNHYKSVAQIFYDPPKGIINTALWAPQGILDIVDGVFAGFDALPGRMGSNVRERGEVNSFTEGVREGGKGLFYGWWDGITGLATEPIEGAKKEGAAGFIKGAGRSWVNVTAKPAAGILGTMALPMRGAWKTLRQKAAGAPQKTLRKPREEMSIDEASRLSPDKRSELLKHFDSLMKDTNQRREELKKRAKLMLQGDERAYDPDSDLSSVNVSQEEAPMQGSSEQGQKEKGGKGEEQQGEAAARAQQGAKGLAAVSGAPISNDATQQDSAAPEEMSEAERRGYERAMREMAAQKK